MAKNKGGQRARRKARQAKRARAEAQAAAQAPVVAEKSRSRLPFASKSKDAAPQAQAKKPVKADSKAKNAKPGLVARGKNYLHDVKAEMRRVVWPSKTELRNFSIAVIALLIVFGVVVWLVDTGVVAALVGYSGLRG